VPPSPFWKRKLKTLRMRMALSGGGVDRLGSVFLRPPADIALLARGGGLRLGSRVLAVGCGEGRLLHRMASWGFMSLPGVDPFVAADTEHPDGVRILRRGLDAVRETYDLVMLHHSFEHMPDAS